MKKNASLSAICFCLLISGCGGTTQTSGPDIGTITGDVSIQFDEACLGKAPAKNTFAMSINGAGDFRMSKHGDISYVRSGTFQLEVANDIRACGGLYPALSGYIVNSAGSRLTGYNVDESGVLVTGTISDINIYRGAVADSAPKSSTKINAQVLLDSRVTTLPLSEFDRNNSSTYHFETSIDLYDTLGSTHALRVFYIKTSTNDWSVLVSNEEAGGAVLVENIAQLTMDAAGGVASTLPIAPFSIAIPVRTGATTPMSISFDPSGTTQIASSFSATSMSQDGHASGGIAGFSILSNGKIMARLSNGLTQLAAQITLKR